MSHEHDDDPAPDRQGQQRTPTEQIANLARMPGAAPLLVERCGARSQRPERGCGSVHTARVVEATSSTGRPLRRIIAPHYGPARDSAGGILGAGLIATYPRSRCTSRTRVSWTGVFDPIRSGRRTRACERRGCCESVEQGSTVARAHLHVDGGASSLVAAAAERGLAISARSRSRSPRDRNETWRRRSLGRVS